jgi:hypothetical protein
VNRHDRIFSTFTADETAKNMKCEVKKKHLTSKAKEI